MPPVSSPNEAASGLNPDLGFSEKGTLPLVWFGIFAERLDCPLRVQADLQPATVMLRHLK